MGKPGTGTSMVCLISSFHAFLHVKLQNTRLRLAGMWPLWRELSGTRKCQSKCGSVYWPDTHLYLITDGVIPAKVSNGCPATNPTLLPKLGTPFRSNLWWPLTAETVGKPFFLILSLLEFFTCATRSTEQMWTQVILRQQSNTIAKEFTQISLFYWTCHCDINACWESVPRSVWAQLLINLKLNSTVTKQLCWVLIGKLLV